MKTGITPNIKSAIVAMLSFAVVTALRADTITITNTNDSGPGSLRQALVDVNDGDTIDFAVIGTIGLSSGELLVNNSVTISGPGADNLAVDGSGASRVFRIGFGRLVTISGLTITNGNANDDFGGGVYNDHATLILNTCIVSGNSAGFADGGGVYSDGSFSHASVTVNDSIFSGNTASDGGGVYNDGNQGGNAMLTVSNTTFSDNSVSNYGGAIYNFGESGNATVTLVKSTVSDNSAGNTGTGYGGGIYNNGLGGNATVNVYDSTISGNSTSGGDGGGIANFGASSNATLAVSNSTFSNNSSIVVGGGIYNDGENGSAPLMLNDCTFSDNFADAAGDNIYDEGEGGSAPVTFANTILRPSHRETSSTTATRSHHSAIT